MSTKNLSNFLTEKHSILAPYLHTCWGEYENSYGRLDPRTAESMGFFSDFLRSGKLIRGSVVLLSARLFNLDDETMLPLAAAMELIQSFLLVHDDVMDKSEQRRGKPSVHSHYKHLLESDKHAVNKHDAAHFGISQAICLGDISMLCALHQVTHANIEAPAMTQIIKRVTNEIMHVGVAQMMDIFHSHYKPTLGEIHTMYRYKTARYTFSLPLSIPAIIAQRDTELSILSNFGEALGILFQIKDDIMDFSTHNTGKSKGLDLAAGKHTMLRAVLELCEHPAAKLFNDPNPTDSTYKQVYEACHSGKAADYLSNIIQEQVDACEMALGKLEEQGMDVILLSELLEYSRGREK